MRSLLSITPYAPPSTKTTMGSKSAAKVDKKSKKDEKAVAAAAKVRCRWLPIVSLRRHR